MEIDSNSRPGSRESAARRAEREADRRIEQANRRVKESEIQAEQTLDQQRDTYEKRSELERARQEASLERQRFEGYERVRDAQKQSANQQSSIERLGEKTAAERTQHYSSQLQNIERDGEKKFRGTLAQNHQAQETLRHQNADSLEAMDQAYLSQKTALQAERDEGIQTLVLQTEAERKALHAKTQDAIAGSKDHYESLYEKTVADQRGALTEVTRQSNLELDERRLSSAHRLDAYSSRQKDPFYKLVNLNAEVFDHDDAFVLKATVPEHEQDKIQVIVRGEEIVVSGKRRNEERVEVEPGRVRSTSTYQSFSESFPIDWPVEPKNMFREFDGDTLTVLIPKKTIAGAQAFRAKRATERAEAEYPRLPKNLPGERELERQVTEKREAAARVAEREKTTKNRARRPIG